MTPQTDAEGFVRRAIQRAHSHMDLRDVGLLAAELAAMLDAARASEREACAVVAANHRCIDKYRHQFGWPHTMLEIAAAIRARGERKEIC